MEKIKLLPLALLGLFVGKLLLSGANFADATVVLGLAGVTCLFEYIEKQKKIKDIADVVNMQNDAIKKMALQLDEMRSTVNTVRATAGIKRVGT